MARGYSRKFTDEHIDIFRAVFPEGLSEQGVINLVYAVNATKALENADFNCAFLYDRVKQKFKHLLLVELGRFENTQDLILAAKKVCELAQTEKHNVKQWVKIIRSMRLKKF